MSKAASIATNGLSCIAFSIGFAHSETAGVYSPLMTT